MKNLHAWWKWRYDSIWLNNKYASAPDNLLLLSTCSAKQFCLMIFDTLFDFVYAIKAKTKVNSLFARSQHMVALRSVLKWTCARDFQWNLLQKCKYFAVVSIECTRIKDLLESTSLECATETSVKLKKIKHRAHFSHFFQLHIQVNVNWMPSILEHYSQFSQFSHQRFAKIFHNI